MLRMGEMLRVQGWPWDPEEPAMARELEAQARAALEHMRDVYEMRRMLLERDGRRRLPLWERLSLEQRALLALACTCSACNRSNLAPCRVCAPVVEDRVVAQVPSRPAAPAPASHQMLEHQTKRLTLVASLFVEKRESSLALQSVGHEDTEGVEQLYSELRQAVRDTQALALTLLRRGAVKS